MPQPDHPGIPPIGSLRAFAAAARHLSFAAAAAELNVTTSAVSHQMRTLEEWIGAPLFHRSSRPLTLTSAGTKYAAVVIEAFRAIAAAGRELRDAAGREPLAISTMSSFATSWLVPRLHSLQALIPALDVRLSISDKYADLEREGFDLAIRYGNGEWKGVTACRLADDVRIAVASPALLSTAADPFRKLPLLHDASMPGWREWFEAFDLGPLPQPSGHAHFTHTHLALQAAGAGAGVALASEILARDLLSSGQLVRAGSASLTGPGGYYLVCPAGRSEDPRVAGVRAWLARELKSACS